MIPTADDELAELDARWAAERAGWARSMGRLRLDAEPLGDQLLRHRSASLALIAISAAASVAFVAAFAAFSRPLLGIGFSALFLLPIVIVSWLDQRRMAGRVREYEEALRAHLANRERLAGGQAGRSDRPSQD